MNTDVRPGLHNNFRLQEFAPEAKNILLNLKRRWYLTNSGSDIHMGTSVYRYVLMKPTSQYTNAFGLDREICLLFSPYQNFEPRTLDAFDVARERVPGIRVDPLCRVLVSTDPAIAEKIASLFAQEPEQPIIIPFTYSDLINDFDGAVEFNRFRKFFFSRDLFSVQGPLRKDTFFFGRTKLVQELTDRFKSGENSGLFGLRKSGKTSIIYSIQRWAKEKDERAIAMDCESPSVHGLRWYELLGRIVRLYHEAKQSPAKTPDTSNYTPASAADQFRDDMLKIFRSKKATPTLLVFDEIERISLRTGSSRHWADSDDFVFFWQSIRAFIQENPGVLSFLIVGTNPQSVEQPKIGSHDNPLFALVPPTYVPCFEFEQTKEMIETLGSYMGLAFSPLVTARIQTDFGGHPFLTRQICSHIHKNSTSSRPINVDISVYEESYKTFLKIGASYLSMVVDVLRDQYSDEYDLLMYLAQGKQQDYESISSLFQVNHLEGYGLVERQAKGPILSVNAIKDHLVRTHRYEFEIDNNESRADEIGKRSLVIEISLRGLIRRALRATRSEVKATESILAALPSERREKLAPYSFKELLQDQDGPLFLLDLKSIISKEWDGTFKNIFPVEKDRCMVYFDEINEMRRVSAHPKTIDKDGFNRWRSTIKLIEKWIEDID